MDVEKKKSENGLCCHCNKIKLDENDHRRSISENTNGQWSQCWGDVTEEISFSRLNLGMFVLHPSNMFTHSVYLFSHYTNTDATNTTKKLQFITETISFKIATIALKSSQFPLISSVSTFFPMEN